MTKMHNLDGMEEEMSTEQNRLAEENPQIDDGSEEWWQSAPLAYIVFGHAYDSIDDAVRGYQTLDEDSRRRVLEGSMKAAKGYVNEHIGKWDPEDTPELMRTFQEMDLRDNLIRTDSGCELVRRAFLEMEYSVRTEAKSERYCAIAVMPKAHFAGKTASPQDVIDAVLKLTSGSYGQMAGRSRLLQNMGDNDLALKLGSTAMEIAQLQDKILDWIVTPAS